MMTKDPEVLAVGCAYILRGRATPEYPGSTRANPSYVVRVGLLAGPPINKGDVPLFPIKTRWDVWQQVVVPVLQEMISEAGAQGWTYETLVAQTELALTNQMKKTGFLPPDPVTPSPDSPPSDGEPIVRDAPRGDPRYPVLDVTSIENPEGNPRLVYGEVDGGPKQ